MKNNSLQGCSVVVTRPSAQAQGLAELIENAGGNVILFPVLKITPIDDNSELDTLIHEIEQYSILIFISPNAVNFGLSYILKQRQIPDNCKIATVGKGSARCAKELLKRDIDIVPEAFDGQSGGYNSESLLSLPALKNVANHKIAILRGNGGRKMLGDTLRDRAAQVRYINTYQRTIPDDEQLENRIQELITHVKNIDSMCVTITSEASLTNFLTLLGTHAATWLNNSQLIVINERLVSIAQQLGFKKQAIVALNASDQALADSVANWYSNKAK